MPIFKFKCPECDQEFSKLLPKRSAVKCTCGSDMQPLLPTSVNSVTKELKDPYRGVSHAKGLKEQLKKRMNDHHDRHDVIQKIDEFGIDDAKKFGWDKRTKRT